ncbi:MAG: HigA family addiction module antitoxin [Clostridiaceae bacterium]
MSNISVYKDLIAFHPGSYIQEIIENLDMTQEEFVEKLETSSKTFNEIISGEAPLSKDMANKLSELTGISYKTWMSLQDAYNIKVLEIKKKRIDKV